MSILQAIFHPAQDYRSLKHGHGVNPTCQHWLYVILHWSFWLWRLTCCWPATWLWIKQVQKMNEWLSFAMEVLHIWSVEHHQCFFFFFGQILEWWLSIAICYHHIMLLTYLCHYFHPQTEKLLEKKTFPCVSLQGFSFVDAGFFCAAFFFCSIFSLAYVHSHLSSPRCCTCTHCHRCQGWT